jgi:hypothetical protein
MFSLRISEQVTPVLVLNLIFCLVSCSMILLLNKLSSLRLAISSLSSNYVVSIRFGK